MPNIKAQHVSIRNIGMALAAIGAAATLVSGSVRFIRGIGDGRYVQRDTLTAYQQGEARKDTIAIIQHDYEVRDIHAQLARLDTNVKCLRPKFRLLPACQ